jgi:hypothetical protein
MLIFAFFARTEPNSCRSCRTTPSTASCALCVSDVVARVGSAVGNETRPSSKMDYQWLEQLDAPQAAALNATAFLVRRANGLASTIGPAAVTSLGEVDVCGARCEPAASMRPLPPAPHSLEAPLRGAPLRAGCCIRRW